MINLIQSERILCVDPGPEFSGALDFDGVNFTIASAEYENNELLALLQKIGPEGNGFVKKLIIEDIVGYGSAVGQTTFDTMFWVGRMVQAFGAEHSVRVSRRDVRMFFLNSASGSKSAMRHALYDLFPQTGGGTRPAIGTKKEPGPLFGITSHLHEALQLGMWYKYSGACDKP